MNIRDFLNNQTIVAELESNDKEGILKELAKPLVSKENNIDLNLLIEKLIEREKLSSTGIGDGIAIPHCKYRNIDGILMSFGKSTKGIDFDSIDKSPVNFFFLLVAPDTPKAAGEHLRTLAKITRMLKSDDFKNLLMNAKTKQEIYKVISKEDENY
jgi:PTS system nitrogen regulatory IIA component